MEEATFIRPTASSLPLGSCVDPASAFTFVLSFEVAFLKSFEVLIRKGIGDPGQKGISAQTRRMGLIP